MSNLSLELNQERRREVALDTMRAVRATNGGLRHAAGLAIVAMGEWLAAERTTSAASLSPATATAKASGDCV